jgi:hypothetical protein
MSDRNTQEQSILLVSIAFPPKSDAEGLQVAKYTKYLTEACKGEFFIDVVTSAIPTLNIPYDPGLEIATKGFRQTVTLRIFENRYTNFIFRRLWPGILERPDSKFSFHWQAPLVPQKLKTPPSVIYSRSFPASSAVMALRLRNHYKVPWVMHLSDLWADSPDANHPGASAGYNQKMERRCFEAADVIALTSQKTIAYYKKKYSELNKRYVHFPNVYDPADTIDIKTHRSDSTDKLRLVHTGSLAGLRSAEPFLKAIELLPADAQKRLEIVFAGHVDRKNARILKKYRCGHLSYLGPLSYRDALELQRSADVLLLIDLPVSNPELRVFFPSKILDYMAAGKPIFAITDEGSESQSVIQDSLGHCFDRRDTGSIRDHLIWLVDAKFSKKSSYFETRHPLKDYDASLNSRRLANLFREILSH